MLPSQSTLAKDPSLFPLCGAGTAALSGSSVPPTGNDAGDAADFGALIGDLAPIELPAETTTPDLGACCLPVLGLAFVPPPVPLAPEPVPAAGVGGGFPGASDATDHPGDANSLWGGRTRARPEWTGPGASAAFATGTEREGSGRIPGLASAPGAADSPASPRTVAERSARAMQTPPYAGLPSAALEHRQSATLPPGIARLQALQADTAATPDAVAVDTGTASGLPEPAESSVFATGPQVTFRGTALTKPDHPGDAARAALERNGFAADEPIHRGADRPVPPEEKIAGRRDGLPSAFQEPAGVGKKRFLATEEELLVTHGRGLGTDSARAGNAMSATSLHSPPTHPNSQYAVASLAAAGQLPSDVLPPGETADTFSTAHEAVEVVLHAVEHVASREQKSVQLKFAVAGEELAVRVELRADEVRTTFRTDSAELRATLEYEWHQMSGASTATDRAVRVSPAVFSAAGQSTPDAFNGDTSSRDRRAGTPRDEFELPVAGTRGRTVATAAHDLSLPVTAAPTRSGGTHRLHTLA